MKENIIYLSPSELKPYENNPRFNDEAVNMVAKSIEDFGFKNPIIVDKDMVIIAGHTRLKAAEKLGLEEVPVIIADDLTQDQANALRLVDNKTAEAATWDFDKLKQELENIEMDLTDFNFDFDPVDENPIEDDGFDVEEALEETEPIVKRGQVWKLGNHYLMCGDATSKEDIEKLLSQD